MSKFNDWMIDRGYGILYDDKLAINYNDNCDAHILGSKQMLIGYMIEYLLEKDVAFVITELILSVDVLYDYLKDIIEND